MGPQMVALIEGQKAFQLNSRVIQTADQIEEIINNLR
jgi:flagellar basal-body rod protein FlgG